MPTMATSAFPLIKVVDIPGKGKGVVALESIPKGTRILSEKPRIRLSDLRGIDSLSLSEDDLYFFLSFPSHGKDEENPVQSRLKHFLPCVGSVDNAIGLFETICRVNHTCYSPLGRPNALYMWREDLKEESNSDRYPYIFRTSSNASSVLSATEDIAAMEEITVSYLQYNIHTEDPFIYLRRKFGFECSCLGCLRPASARQKSVERIKDFRQFTDGLPARIALGGPLGDPPKSLLDSIEKYILMICAEGYVWQLGSCAHDAFQLCAFHGDADSASKWEALVRDSHEILQGADSPADQKSQKLAAFPKTFREWKVLGSQKLNGPCRANKYSHTSTQSQILVDRGGPGHSPQHRSANRHCI
ncbi:hypothetical protein GGX14DRAFT_621194 [Mycena pura]|uniref:SET domain-containing protein n=1 Tax=Mycena pura TaxID=153505 RepID=A0AAD6YCN0_9AGAR|nr:hypothetical protein GGX14DRAFT_621194 [Mycena pura]